MAVVIYLCKWAFSVSEEFSAHQSHFSFKDPCSNSNHWFKDHALYKTHNDVILKGWDKYKGGKVTVKDRWKKYVIISTQMERYFLDSYFESVALPGLMLDIRLLKIIWGGISISSPCGGV